MTGASLLFRDEIERLIHPSLIVTPRAIRVSVQAMLDRVVATHPDATVSRAEFPDRPDQAILFKLKAQADGAAILTAVDPYRGTVVRDGGVSAWPTEWLFAVHDTLLAGPVGETIVGVEGIGLLVLIIFGLISWWPAKRRFRQGFRVKLDGSADVRWRTLHRAAGAALAPLLLISATTGTMMVFKDAIRSAVSIAVSVPGKPTPKVEKRKDQHLLAVDQLVATARAAESGAALRQIRFSSGGRMVAVYLDGRHSIRPDATTQIYYDGYTGMPLDSYVAGEMPPASEFLDWLYPIHIGLWGGVTTRILMIAAGLGLAGFAATGPWLWWSRTAKRRRNRAARVAAS